jgi:hypothetical protein
MLGMLGWARLRRRATLRRWSLRLRLRFASHPLASRHGPTRNSENRPGAGQRLRTCCDPDASTLPRTNLTCYAPALPRISTNCLETPHAPRGFFCTVRKSQIMCDFGYMVSWSLCACRVVLTKGLALELPLHLASRMNLCRARTCPHRCRCNSVWMTSVSASKRDEPRFCGYSKGCELIVTPASHPMRRSDPSTPWQP